MQCTVAIQHIYCMHALLFFLVEKCNRLITGVFFVISLEKYLNWVEIFDLDHFALDAEQNC